MVNTFLNAVIFIRVKLIRVNKMLTQHQNDFPIKAMKL